MLCLSLINVPFYSMEIKFCVVRNLKLIIGEIGPVEVELFTGILFFLGGYLGLDVFEQSIADLTGFNNEYLVAFKLKSVVPVVIGILLALFLFDNISDAIKVNPYETIKLSMPVLVLLAFA